MIGVEDFTGTHATQFEANRGRLQSVAYRILGSLTEAEDAVQETWVRLSRSEPESIDNLAGWLTTVVSRVCLGVLRTRRTRHEEPIVGDEAEHGGLAGSVLTARAEVDRHLGRQSLAPETPVGRDEQRPDTRIGL